jgi:hypothetical protein
VFVRRQEGQAPALAHIFLVPQSAGQKEPSWSYIQVVSMALGSPGVHSTLLAQRWFSQGQQ